MRHERSMVQRVLGGEGWRPGFIPTTSDLAAIEHPTKMIFGSADPTGSVDVWRAFVGRLPNGALHVVEGAGHMPWWDEPREVAGSVSAFLRATPAAGAAVHRG